ncbi:MAG: CHAT domain-containing protein [Myxococcales bacterium]|nr:CHAT domain-containing protein [Myxococcales bacterium]
MLRASPNVPAARAARWNYALLLDRLDLPLSTAAAFHAIAKEREQGWSQEAAKIAQQAEEKAKAERERWQRAHSKGEAMWRTGVPVSEAELRDAPGTMRAYFYYAVRSALSPDRVRALLPVAAELDKDDREPTLSRYVERVAKLDFRRRAPLAALYARAMNGEVLTDAEQRLLTASTPNPEVADIVIGAMFDLDTAPRRLDAFRVLATASGDRWFEIVLALVEAEVDKQRGDWLGAEARLAHAAERCTEGAAYQCIELARQRGHIYQHLHRIPEALEVVKAGIALAGRAHEWERYRQLLVLLADIERFNRSTATARAYAGEVLLMAEPAPCDQRNARDRAIVGAAHQAIAGAALLDVNGHDARRAFDEAVKCTAPDLSAISSFADIGRLDPLPDDLPRLRAWLAPLRANKTSPPADRIFADTIEGRLQLESKAATERAAGTALLEQAIAAADALRGTTMADKARAAAYSVLIFDDVYRHGHARALALFARELGIPMPTRCVVGMSAEDERAVVVVRGADGQDHATYNNKRRTGAEAQLVPDELATRLAGCAQVQVIARTELQGQRRVLPADLAWSYVTGAHRRTAPASSSPRSLVITNVKTPPALRLEALQAVPAVADTTLSGPSATPSLVLAKMRDATEIQFHTHALVDAGVSDASHLVLSAEPDGRYALTAEAIRTTTLRGQPIVVLAACRSAQGARYQHAPWSLPDAFLAAGAHAVFAAATDIPDSDSGAFFDRVLARVRAGEAPAAALRDERLPILKIDPDNWVGDVLLFE